jgi:putative ubiquitin-RnfH superfamily antitoxin RatB of RatAB toxin-antitoxin module
MSRHKRLPIRVSIYYALPDEVWARELILDRGTTAIEAVNESGILDAVPGLDGTALKLGVFGELVDGHYMLEDGDRIEVYRPLVADPKEVRRELARQGKTMGNAK